MAGTFVVDASVVVDFLAPMEDSLDSERFMRGLSWPDPITLLAPDVVFLEAANALRNLALRRVISRQRAERAATALGRMPIASVPCSSVVEGAWSLSRTVTVYDGAYLSLAGELDVAYVTKDRPAARASKQMGIRAFHVSDADLRNLIDSLEPPSPRRG
ncbi:MAG: type II toxin-antitoxin system VapC family toxin [Actinomycetota bacterium]